MLHRPGRLGDEDAAAPVIGYGRHSNVINKNRQWLAGAHGRAH